MRPETDQSDPELTPRHLIHVGYPNYRLDFFLHEFYTIQQIIRTDYAPGSDFWAVFTTLYDLCRRACQTVNQVTNMLSRVVKFD